MARTKPAPTRNSTAADALLSLVERCEHLMEQIADLKSDLKAVEHEAKGQGFDVAALRRIVKDRAEDETQRARRQETETLIDIYRAALGLLDGTPLGEAARTRLAPAPSPPADDAAAEPPPPAQPSAQEQAEARTAARTAGGEAARAGARILDNPHHSGDPRRAAWDEGWCAATGSDGMDIPAAFRRREPPKLDATPPADPPDDAT